MNGVRVAVLIACYDDGATLEEAIDSLRDQEPHELVVVDDGSTDPATLAVLDRLRGRGVRVVRQENAGLSAARMTGVHETEAPYVLPLDADDKLAPGSLSRLAGALDADPGAALAWGDVETFGDVTTRVQGAPALDPWHITYVSEIPVCSLIRRTALLEAGGWQIAGYEDWDLWMALAERDRRGVHVPGVTLLHRRHGRRMNADCLDNHGEKLVELRARHPRLFADRRANWRHSRLPWRVRALSPLVAALPLVSAFDKHRLYRLVSRPGEVLPGRRERLRTP
jgi:glycosyltransferase involved in cell wall biosynthesis